ncbi:Altered inheritance of mitochondria protein 18 mitochondrial [Ophidiomyces ophidiicola]|nr:Altered inheritance of mitochondria protein 18 mitochondrial [Ophidiomyces ophidiicola]KAI1921218.1 Altered inheritance of mitochondria protein 18 mitochondrial [Ophidiomyces ophidiicola]KAI2017180.1 Altered inheritance of mitochondria protein 18 mitochondrial [Ophidiomyces ophidiicola]KAI2026014.1 Altered inheritance of mitochondria protein 18 mitochondrial [Ophidiomyces ophidiicola]KAI2061008.1 Altered inheritance of mitochondria protein 18 mitochondrial [Ophidiomyces ophidiicola]
MPPHLPIHRMLCQCVSRSPAARPSHVRFLSSSQLLRSTANPLRNASRSARKSHGEYKRSVAISAAGMISCAVAMLGVITIYFPDGVQKKSREGQDNNAAIKLDGPSGLIATNDATVVIDGFEQVPTGNSTVPHFPKSIRLPKTLDSPTSRPAAALVIGEEVKKGDGKEEEYHLLGLGIRTVSFLSIQVYVVGLYIAASDVAALQKRLVRQGASPVTSAPDSAVTATSLVPHERDELKKILLDPERGEDVWNQILKEGGIRTALRIIPTRNTDFLHLRDGWVRAITARAQKANAKAKELAAKEGSSSPAVSEFGEDSFGLAMGEFKALMGGGVRKNVPKGQTLMLLRDRVGALEILYQPGDKKPMLWLGEVADERVSRLLWMQYLAGKNVASDGARQNIIEGVMGIVERPVGTVEQMVA